MSSSRKCSAALLGLILTALAATVSAQTERGSIVGLVTDPQGAAIPGANVRVVNVGTNVETVLTTNEQGLFEAPFLIPGTYRVTASSQGFATSNVDDIVVTVGSRVRADLALQIGEVTTVVEVTGGSPLLRTEDANISQQFEYKTLQELPTGDRNIYSYLLLAPNVVQPGGGNTPAFRLESGGSFSVSGSRPSAVTFKIDGASNTDPTFGSPTVTPSLDSVQEFQVQNNAYSAEYEGISQVNVATKSGTNDFHGTAFEFFRNDALQPRDPRLPLDESGKPGKAKLRWNQFGGSLGGPIVKNKTFFHFSYEGRRFGSLGAGFTQVFTPAERAGDFSGALGACQQSDGATIPIFSPGGAPTSDCVRVGQIFDPLTTAENPGFDSSQPVTPLNPQLIRQPFPNNQIPSSRIHSTATNLIDVQQPLPNSPGDPLRNFLGEAGTEFDNDQYAIRGDHNLSDSDRIFGRLTLQDNSRLNNAVLPFTTKDTVGEGKVVNVSWTRVLSPGSVNELRAGYVRGVYGDFLSEGTDPVAVGIRNTNIENIPSIRLTNSQAYGGFSASLLSTIQNTYQISDNFSKIFGRHSMKFGFKMDHNRFQNGNTGTNSNGSMFFTGIYTKASDATAVDTDRTNSIADFLLGSANSTTLRFPALANIRNLTWAVYAQDDWKLAPRLTLNLGLRYERHTPWREQLMGGALLDLSGDGFVHVADPAVAAASDQNIVKCCVNDRITPADKTDWGPRIGLAYQPFANDSLTIRAGYGLYYSDNTQFFHWGTYTPRLQPSFNSTSGDFQRPGATLDNPFPEENVEIAGGFESRFNGVPPEVLNNQPMIRAVPLGDYSTPYTQQWSLSIQRSLGYDLVMDLSYTGSNAKNLPIQWIFNQPTASAAPQDITSSDPARNFFLRRPWRNFDQFSFTVTNLLQSSYNAFNAKLQKRFSHGFSFLAGYTWSKSIDTGSEVFALNSTFNLLSNNRDINRDRGVSTFDVTHRGVLNGIYELPFGQGNRGGWVNKLVGGWRVSGSFALQSGFPFSPNVRNRRTNTGYTLVTERGDFVGNPTWSEADWNRLVSQWETGELSRLALVDPSAVSLDYPAGTFGNVARNVFRTPFGRNLDYSIAKSTSLTEGLRLEIRADVIGATQERLHRPTLARNVCANNCLARSGLAFTIPARSAFFNPRTLQVGAKFIF